MRSFCPGSKLRSYGGGDFPALAPCTSPCQTQPVAMSPLVLFLSLTAAVSTDDTIPQALPKARYAETLGKSPFVLETKSTDVAPVDKVNPFQNLYLRGIGKADGRDYVLIQRLGEERPMRFIGNEPGTDDLAVKSVRIGSNFRETRVVLQKGAETGEVGFKEDTLSAPPPAAPGMRQPSASGQFPKPGAVPIPQPQNPASRPPQPGNGTVQVPRPQGNVPMPQMPQPVSMPQIPGAPKQRMRVINN